MSDQEKEAPNWPPLPLQVSPSLVASDWAVAVCYHLNGSAGGSEVVAKGTGNSNDITKALRWAKEFASQRMQWWCHKETLFSLDDRLRRTFWTRSLISKRTDSPALDILFIVKGYIMKHSANHSTGRINQSETSTQQVHHLAFRGPQSSDTLSHCKDTNTGVKSCDQTHLNLFKGDPSPSLGFQNKSLPGVTTQLKTKLCFSE